MGDLNEALQPGANEADFSGVDRVRLIEALSGVLQATALLYHQEELRPYECDGLSVYRQVPMAVVLPQTEAQVAAVLRIAGDPVERQRLAVAGRERMLSQHAWPRSMRRLDGIIERCLHRRAQTRSPTLESNA